MKRITVIGASGMLGSTIFRYLNSKDDISVSGTVRKITKKIQKISENKIIQIENIFNVDDIDKVIKNSDYIINCIGAIKQKTENSNADYVLVNSYLPHLLAERCSIYNTRLIHFSTDCIYDGKEGNYKDNRICNALDMYGRSKALGEVSAPHALTIRTSIIGHELASSISLVDWFLKSDSNITGFNKAIFSGLPTVEIAEFIYNKIIGSDINGVFNLSAEPISKYELLKIINHIYGAQKNISQSDKFSIDRSLDSSNLRALTGYSPPSWEELVRKMYVDYKKLMAVIYDK